MSTKQVFCLIFTLSLVASNELDDYVNKDDGYYSYELMEDYIYKAPDYTSYTINMTSQKWLTGIYFLSTLYMV